ncbi:MAG: hypothetical protein FWG21_01200, partial [Oscillospiraceae bacterium]|nr:hypothetical protein [Oscillospiraceae bacterium]
MKRITIFLLVLLLLLGLTSCKETEIIATPAIVETTTEAEKPIDKSESIQKEEVYLFRYMGFDIAIDDDMEDIIAVLGEPLSYFEATSCAFDGLDKTYTYSGFDIVTRPEGEK